MTYLESRPQLLSDQVRREVAWTALLAGRLQQGEILGDATLRAFARMQFVAKTAPTFARM